MDGWITQLVVTYIKYFKRERFNTMGGSMISFITSAMKSRAGPFKSPLLPPSQILFDALLYLRPLVF